MIHRIKFALVMLFFLTLSFFARYTDSPAAEKDAIKPGDKVGIQFTCRFPSGEIAASTSTAVAADSSLRKSRVFMPRSKDDPLEVTAGQSVGAKAFPVPFLDEIASRISMSIPGMKLGETRTIEIRSELPADVPEKERFLQMARIRQRPKEIRMTRDEYKSRTRKDPEVGAEYVLDPAIPGKVASVSENEVLIRFSAQPGSVVETPFGKGTIRENGNQLEIVIDAVKGTPVLTGPIVGRISDVQEKMFTIDYGHPFAGEPLTCEVKTEKVSEAKLSKEEK
jgi:FKBP-type peptidyl-prolyl cis-trans isomerase 2